MQAMSTKLNRSTYKLAVVDAQHTVIMPTIIYNYFNAGYSPIPLCPLQVSAGLEVGFH